MRFFLALILFSCSLAVTATTVAVPSGPKPVIDLTDTLSLDQQQSIASQLKGIQEQQGTQIAVLLLPHTGDETIEQFSMRVVEGWKLGREGVDDGLLLLIAKESRKLRIEVGYGLEGSITDAVASRIIREHIAPKLKEGDYAEGIKAGITQIEQLIKGESLPQADKTLEQPSEGLTPMGQQLAFALILALIISALMSKLLNPENSPHYIAASIALVIGFISYYLIAGGLPYALACAAMSFVCTLLFGWAGGGSSNNSGSSSRSSSRSGGLFGGGGSSGSW